MTGAGGLKRVSPYFVKNSTVLTPERKGQIEIVTYLDDKIEGIASLVKKKEQYLTELESYKKSLIYEYVIGKKEVV